MNRDNSYNNNRNNGRSNNTDTNGDVDQHPRDRTEKNNNHSNIVCGENFKTALNTLLSAHSRDILEIENEFQQQKQIWEKERDMLIRACKKLKDQNDNYKSKIKLFKQQYGALVLPKDNGIVGGGNDQSNDINKNNDNNTQHQRTQNITQLEDDGFRQKKKSSTTSKSNGNTQQSNNSKTVKKRKNAEDDQEEVKDELDLPMIHDHQQALQMEEEHYLNVQSNTQNPNFQIIDFKKPIQPKSTITKKHKIQEVIRNQEERSQLNGYECEHCKEFYDAVLGKDYDKKILLNQCSRHRRDSSPPSTPPGFWDFDFGTTK